MFPFPFPSPFPSASDTISGISEIITCETIAIGSELLAPRISLSIQLGTTVLQVIFEAHAAGIKCGTKQTSPELTWLQIAGPPVLRASSHVSIEGLTLIIHVNDANVKTSTIIRIPDFSLIKSIETCRLVLSSSCQPPQIEFDYGFGTPNATISIRIGPEVISHAMDKIEPSLRIVCRFFVPAVSHSWLLIEIFFGERIEIEPWEFRSEVEDTGLKLMRSSRLASVSGSFSFDLASPSLKSENYLNMHDADFVLAMPDSKLAISTPMHADPVLFSLDTFEPNLRSNILVRMLSMLFSLELLHPSTTRETERILVLSSHVQRRIDLDSPIKARRINLDSQIKVKIRESR